MVSLPISGPCSGLGLGGRGRQGRAKTWKAFPAPVPATIVDVRSRHEVVGRLLATDRVTLRRLGGVCPANHPTAAGRVAKPGVPIVFFRARLPGLPTSASGVSLEISVNIGIIRGAEQDPRLPCRCVSVTASGWRR